MSALSSFWPAVAPDASRGFDGFVIEHFPTVSPMTDEEIGQNGNLPWDGVVGPKVMNTQDKDQIEYVDFDYVDYVGNMLENKFTLKLTSQVDISKYESRIMALSIVYRSIKSLFNPKLEWRVLSFKEISSNDPELEDAKTQTGGSVLNGDIYRIEVYRHGNSNPKQGDFKKVLVEVKERMTFFAGSGSRGMVLLRDKDGTWRSREVPNI